ncbi:MAG: hypothetical protein HC817_03630 [Saprospiraceae bacterium]|nr:hypothetical protein [Saprospiraceae bacterium]
MKEALQKWQKQTNTSLIYNPNDILDVVVPNSDVELAISAKNIDRLLKGTPLIAQKISDNVYVIKPKNHY